MSSKDNMNLENLLQMAITSIRDGNKEGARLQLQRILDIDKKNDRAWMLLARVAENADKRRQYLETALKYNPSNKQAKEALQKIGKSKSSREQRTLLIGGLVILIIGIFAVFACLIVLLAS
jgi:Tfp pilus assembly protein PilF